MPRTGDANGIKVMLLDQAVDLNVNEIEPRRRVPMAQETRLDVFRFQGFPQKRIVVKIDLTSGKVICGTPVAIDGLEFGVSIEGSCCTPVTIGVIRGHACFRI